LSLTVAPEDVLVALPLWPDPDELDEINLDYAATTPALVAAVRAVERAIPWYASLHRGGGRKSSVSTTLFEEARAAVARFVSCEDASDVIFVRNTTEAANLLAAALPSGTRVLCSPSEHHANLLPWRRHRVDHLPFTTSAAAFLDAAAKSLEAAHRSGDPFSLVAITGASNVTGEVPPVAELARLAHGRGALVFVDGAQLAPHRPLDVGVLDVDFLAFSGHKIYAPFGTGALVSRAGGLADGSPLLHGGGAVRLVTLNDAAWAPSPRRYEAGTPNLLGAVALGAACNALTAFGMEEVAAQERALASVLWAGLDAIPGVHQLRQWRDAPDRVGVAAFTADGWAAHELGAHLGARGIAVRAGSFCAHPLVSHLLGIAPSHTDRLLREISDGGDVSIPGAVRASVGLGTTRAEIDTFLRVVREALAATT